MDWSIRGTRVLALLCWAMSYGSAQAETSQASSLEFSCDAFPAPLGEADLIERFGPENVVTDTLHGSEDGPILGTVVNPDDPTTRIEIAWLDPARRRDASWARVRTVGSRWVTSHGLRVGQDLRSVERANGRPFRLSGFVQEGGNGGAVLSWGRGRLGGRPADRSCSELIVFQHPYDGTAPVDALRQVDRLQEVSSGHPAMQEVNPVIVVISLVYGRGAD